MKYMLVAIAAAAIAAGCTDERSYVFDGEGEGNVEFTVVNMTYGAEDSAVSLEYEDRWGNGFYVPYGHERELVYESAYIGNPEMHNENRVYLRSEHELWAGGNSELKFIFKPKCEEEKSATFTLPDGSTRELTRSDSVFTWKVDSLSMSRVIPEMTDGEHLFVKAESSYKKDNVSYSNVGFVVIRVDRGVAYFPLDNPYTNSRWYYFEWMYSSLDDMNFGVDFTMENFSVGADDSGQSSVFRGYYDEEGYRYTYLEFPIWEHVEGGGKTEVGTWSGVLQHDNVVWGGINSEFEIRYTANNGYTGDVTFVMPDNSVHYCNGGEDKFLWTLGDYDVSELNTNDYGYLVVEAFWQLDTGNGVVDNHSYMLIDYTRDYTFDSVENGWFRTQTRSGVK